MNHTLLNMTTKGEEVLLSPELNGDVSGRSDKVPSVHNNIFFKAYGRTTRHHSSSNRYEEAIDRNGLETDTTFDEDIGEYHPGSGFVTKLLGKFSNLSNREGNFTPRYNRTSSLERELSEDRTGPKKAFSLRDHSTKSEPLEKQSLVLPKLTQKAESIECLDHIPFNRSRPKFPIPLRHIDRKDNVEKPPPKSLRESAHIVAPDADLARDDIVIIENPPVPPLALETSDDDKEDNTPPISSYRDEVPVEELPKPNTVVNVRSIFETANASSTSSVRKFRADSSSELKPESSLNRDKQSSSSPITSPRILSYDTPAPSWLARKNSIDSSSPSSNNISSSTNNKSDVTTNYTKHTSNDNRPRSASNSDILFPKETRPDSSSISDRGNIFDNGRAFESSRSAPSPRSTASVKPTIASNPVSNVNVKPIPISNPPSAATSFKKSPVVPVAPFKKQEEKIDDGSPVMIYEKPKSPSRRVRPERIRKYDEVSSKSTDGKKDYIISNDKQNKSQIECNHFKAEKFSMDKSSETRTQENNITNISNNKEKTFSFIKPTINENNEKDIKQTSNKDDSLVSVGKDRTTISVNHNKTQISISKDTSDNKLESKKYRAPTPEKQIASPRTEKESVKRSCAPEPPSTQDSSKDVKPQSMLYISSSASETSESETSPPETPRTQSVIKPSQIVRVDEPMKIPPHRSKVPESPRGKPSEPVKNYQEPLFKKTEEISIPVPENSDKPIKGIPSIIAQRLNRQKNSPRDVSSSVAAKDELDSLRDGKPHSNGSVDNRLILLKNSERENPVKATEPSKEVVSSEIENEIAAVRRKMDSSRSKGSGPAQIFDSSQLAKKREENKRQRAAAVAAQGIVPRLDFSSLNEDTNKSKRVAQKEIKPCNIKFIGENAKTSRSLLKKQRKVKVRHYFKYNLFHHFLLLPILFLSFFFSISSNVPARSGLVCSSFL